MEAITLLHVKLQDIGCKLEESSSRLEVAKKQNEELLKTKLARTTEFSKLTEEINSISEQVGAISSQNRQLRMEHDVAKIGLDTLNETYNRLPFQASAIVEGFVDASNRKLKKLSELHQLAELHNFWEADISKSLADLEREKTSLKSFREQRQRQLSSEDKALSIQLKKEEVLLDSLKKQLDEIRSEHPPNMIGISNCSLPIETIASKEPSFTLPSSQAEDGLSLWGPVEIQFTKTTTEEELVDTTMARTPNQPYDYQEHIVESHSEGVPWYRVHKRRHTLMEGAAAVFRSNAGESSSFAMMAPVPERRGEYRFQRHMSESQQQRLQNNQKQFTLPAELATGPDVNERFDGYFDYDEE